MFYECLRAQAKMIIVLFHTMDFRFDAKSESDVVCKTINEKRFFHTFLRVLLLLHLQCRLSVSRECNAICRNVFKENIT